MRERESQAFWRVCDMRKKVDHFVMNTKPTTEPRIVENLTLTLKKNDKHIFALHLTRLCANSMHKQIKFANEYQKNIELNAHRRKY